MSSDSYEPIGPTQPSAHLLAVELQQARQIRIDTLRSQYLCIVAAVALIAITVFADDLTAPALIQPVRSASFLAAAIVVLLVGIYIGRMTMSARWINSLQRYHSALVAAAKENPNGH